jgi:hypothetical protein
MTDWRGDGEEVTFEDSGAFFKRRLRGLRGDFADKICGLDIPFLEGGIWKSEAGPHRRKGAAIPLLPIIHNLRNLFLIFLIRA